MSVATLLVLSLVVHGRCAAEMPPEVQAKALGWTAADALRMKAIGPVEVSPDGKRAAFSIEEAVIGKSNGYVAQIHVAEADGSGSRQLTSGMSSSYGPKWSPDGRFLAFLSDQGGSEELWLLDTVDGGRQPLTDVAGEIGQFKWSPSGRQIAFLMASDPSRAGSGARPESGVKVVGMPHSPQVHLWIVDVKGLGTSGARQVTRQPFSIGHPTSGAHKFNWSPDGRQIVFVQLPGTDYDDIRHSGISSVDIATGTVRPLTSRAAAVREPIWSRDGRWIAYLAQDRDAPYYFSVWDVCVVPAGGGESRTLASTFDSLTVLGPGHLLGWSEDSQWIYFHEAAGTVDRIAALPLNGDPPRDIGGGMVIDGARLNAQGTALGFVGEFSDRPPEAYVTPIERFAPTGVSRANADLARKPFGRTEVIQWPSSEGTQIEGILTYPVGYEAGRRYPLLIMAHGGPAKAFKREFDARPDVFPIAVASSQGYVVLRPNPRGSSGYGKAFRLANAKDWGGGDYRDVMAGAEHVITMGIADADRIGMLGWSYGGYLAAWAITQTHRLKAALVGAGMSDLVSYAVTTEQASQMLDIFGAEPWQAPALYADRSPISHAGAVETPTLMLHGEADPRVPVSQSYEFYGALKRRGVPVELVVYPGMGHDPDADPAQLLDIIGRSQAFFDKHLKAAL
jgi:dipeptidyl aminopeptidase/acylaminoacyl peptidase